MVLKLIDEWFQEKKTPVISSKIYENLKEKGYPHSDRTFKKILASLREEGAITMKMISDGEHRGKMGYIPVIEKLETQRKPEKKKVPTSRIEFLVKLLKDEDMSEDIRKLASYRLRDCCSHEVGIERKGKEVLKQFFTELLDKPRKQDEIYELHLVALSDFMVFHSEPEWLLKNWYDKLLNLFRDCGTVELRERALRCLSQIYRQCQETKKWNDKARELYELFSNAFFNPHEREKMAEVAFENLMWSTGDNRWKLEFLNKLYEGCRSTDEELKRRCLEYLKEKVLPNM